MLSSCIAVSTGNALCHLQRARRFCLILADDDLVSVIHPIVTSWPDYSPAMYLGMKPAALWKLQLVPTAALGLLGNTSSYGHTKPGLCSLHWRPIEYQIKVTVLIIKALHGSWVSKRLPKALGQRLWVTTVLLGHNRTLNKARLCRRENFYQGLAKTVEQTPPGAKDHPKSHHLPLSAKYISLALPSLPQIHSNMCI